MSLSRWRRVATGIAAGVIVMCAALIGASLRDDTSGVSVASDLLPTTVIPIADDPVADDADEADGASDSVETGETGDTVSAGGDTSVTDDAASDDDQATDPVTVIDDDELPGDDDTATTPTDEVADATESADAADSASPADDESTTGQDAAEPDPAEPAAPLTAADDSLGTGGGVDDAECALDRLVIYAGARRGGVAGSIRAALARAGFAAGCPTPVTVLASNCPLQFAGVLGAGSGYDPMKSFVAASASVDRETMTAVMGTVGYSGSEIDILDFGFVNPDRPGEQWMAIFVPPSFVGWEDLAGRAGVSPTTASLCAPSGELAG